VKCLIIAAGRGSRLRQRAESKPLVSVLGIPLIERVIQSAADGGAAEFYVVSGYQGPRLREHLDNFARCSGHAIYHIVNDQWQQPNGLSVLRAKAHIDEEFLLLMSDHLFDPGIVQDLVKQPLSPEGLTLAVDSRLNNGLVDLDDVTRVYQQNGRIQAIGKLLTQYNAFDTGIFNCSPAIFEALELSNRDHSDCSLSGGVRVLAAMHRAESYDIGDRFWLDVDDSRSYVRAEVALAEAEEKESIETIRRTVVV
jgi:choline kinase